MKKLIAAAALFLVAAVAGAQTPAPAQQPAPAGSNAETGASLWRNVGCWQCHGYEAQGGAAGPRLAARNLPWTGFSAYVRRPANQMPLYTEKALPAPDLAHIYAYIQSRPAPPQNIPLLQK
jgi:mono/diheme cytochrome c family protein